WERDREDRDVSQDHGEDRGSGPAIPAALGKEAAEPCARDESEEVAARRTDQNGGPRVEARENGDTGGTLGEVGDHGRGAPPAAERGADQEHREGLACYGHRGERKRDRDSGRERDQGASHEREREVEGE